MPASGPASAQGRRPFEDLGRYLQAGDTLPLFVGGGAAIGAGFDALDRDRQLVYGRRPGLTFLRRPLPVSSLGDLWSRVPPGEPVRVRDASVGERRGRFVKASQDALTIEIDLGEVIIPAERVQLVERRSYAPGDWIAIGMAVGGVAGFFKRHDEYNRHATREDAGKGGLLGGMLGFVVSRARAQYTDIYRPMTAAGHDIAVGPVVERGRRGAALTVRF